jgi:hypothetical protein
LLGFSLGDPWGVGMGVAAVWVMIGGLISGAWLVLLALSSFITVTGHREKWPFLSYVRFTSSYKNFVFITIKIFFLVQFSLF